MHTPLVDKAGKAVLLLGLVLLAAKTGSYAFSGPALEAAQVTFEQATMDLTSGDAGTRLRAVQMLRASLQTMTPFAELLLQRTGIDSQRRAETLTVEEFGAFIEYRTKWHEAQNNEG